MLVQPDPPKQSIFRNPFLYSWTALVIFALATVVILEQDSIALEQLGGKELAIQNFYATPGTIRRGETVQLCYGVANARTVKLQPQSNPVWLSLIHI